MDVVEADSSWCERAVEFGEFVFVRLADSDALSTLYAMDYEYCHPEMNAVGSMRFSSSCL